MENYALVKKSKGFNLSLLQPFEYGSITLFFAIPLVLMCQAIQNSNNNQAGNISCFVQQVPISRVIRWACKKGQDPYINDLLLVQQHKAKGG